MLLGEGMLDYFVFVLEGSECDVFASYCGYDRLLVGYAWPQA